MRKDESLCWGLMGVGRKGWGSIKLMGVLNPGRVIGDILLTSDASYWQTALMGFSGELRREILLVEDFLAGGVSVERKSSGVGVLSSLLLP